MAVLETLGKAIFNFSTLLHYRKKRQNTEDVRMYVLLPIALSMAPINHRKISTRCKMLWSTEIIRPFDST